MAHDEAVKAKVRAYLGQLSNGGSANSREVIDIGAPDVAFKLSLPRNDVVVALRAIAREPRSGVTPVNMVLFSCDQSIRLPVHLDARNVRCPVHGDCQVGNVAQDGYFQFEFHAPKRPVGGFSFSGSSLAESLSARSEIPPSVGQAMASLVDLSAEGGAQINHPHIGLNYNPVTNNFYGPAVPSVLSGPDKGENSMSDKGDSESLPMASAKQSSLDEGRQGEGGQASMEQQRQREATVKIGAAGKSKVTRVTSIDTDAEIVAKEESVIEDVSLGVRTVEAPVEPWYKTKEGKIGIAVAVIGGIFAILAALIN